MWFSFLSSPKKTKSAPTEADAQKTQTPIVAKPIQYKGQYCTLTLLEFAFLSNSQSEYEQKEHKYPYKK